MLPGRYKTIIDRAFALVGGKYVYGYKPPSTDYPDPNPKAADCSGIVTYAFNFPGSGLFMPHGTINQAKIGETIDQETALRNPCCLGFKNDKGGHVVITVGDGSVIEAHSNKKGIIHHTRIKRSTWGFNLKHWKDPFSRGLGGKGAKEITVDIRKNKLNEKEIIDSLKEEIKEKKKETKKIVSNTVDAVKSGVSETKDAVKEGFSEVASFPWYYFLPVLVLPVGVGVYFILRR
jgi:hypothetical protein